MLVCVCCEPLGAANCNVVTWTLSSLYTATPPSVTLPGPGINSTARTHSDSIQPALRTDRVIWRTATSTVAPGRTYFSFPKIGSNVIRFLQKVVMFFSVLTLRTLADVSVSERHTVFICRAEVGNSTCLRNIAMCLWVCKTSTPERTQSSSSSLPWKPQNFYNVIRSLIIRTKV